MTNLANRPLRLALLVIAAVGPTCGGGGSGGGMSTVLLASGSIGAAGGTVQVTDVASPAFGTQIVIPAGALAATTEITLRQVTGGGPYPANVLTYEIGPEGTTFAQPVTVTISFLPQYLTDNSIVDTTTLHIVHWPPGSAPKTLRRTGLDVPNHTVTSTITDLCMFSVHGYSNQSLDGDYFFIEMGISEGTSWGTTPTAGLPLPYPQGYFSKVGTQTFDGNGSSTYSFTEKNDQTAYTDSGTDAYSVAPDGTLTIDGDESGTVLCGGEMYVATTISAPNGMSMRIGLKRGGTTYSAASLNGTYYFQYFGIDQTSPQSNTPAQGNMLPAPLGYEATFGAWTFDGAGGYSYTGSHKEDQALSARSDTGTYTITSAGIVTMDGDIRGFLLAGGEVFVAAPFTADEDVNFMILVRRAGTFTNAELTGEYWMQTMHFDASAGQGLTPAVGQALPEPAGYFATFGLGTFDGAGNYTFSGIDKDGYTLAATSGPGTYSIAADGTLTMDSGTTGQVLLGGRMACFTNSTAPSDVSFSIMLLRR